jgi:hypothetical protein
LANCCIKTNFLADSRKTIFLSSRRVWSVLEKGKSGKSFFSDFLLHRFHIEIVENDNGKEKGNKN